MVCSLNIQTINDLGKYLKFYICYSKIKQLINDVHSKIIVGENKK